MIINKIISILVVTSLIHFIVCRDYKADMRQFVIEIANYARLTNKNFIMIPQNGQEVMTNNGEVNGVLDISYINAINGVGREDLFYGYNNDNVATPAADRNYMIAYLDLVKRYNKQVLVTDYCSDIAKMNDSYVQNNKKGYISFAANQRNLFNIPTFPIKPYNENANDITSLNMAKNFLYIINPEKYAKKQDFINAIKATNFDIVFIDAFFNDGTLLTNTDIAQLKTKANGGKRLVISYMSIGEAEDYRYYWKSTWKVGNPAFIQAENPDWKGNYKVKYWDPEWKNIIYGNNASYTKKLLDSNFDGAYLDIIDAFEYFESME